MLSNKFQPDLFLKSLPRQEADINTDIEAAIVTAAHSVSVEDFRYLADCLGILNSVVTPERQSSYRDSPGNAIERLRTGLL